MEPNSPALDAETYVEWKRLWEPAASVGATIVTDGFLIDFDSLFGLSRSRDLFELKDLLDNACLILFGEPGMGKSVTLEKHRAIIERQARETGALIWRKFSEVLSPEDLISDIRNAPEWQAWPASEANLTIVIDGLDEGLAVAPQLVAKLITVFQGKPISRLRLIVTCREVDWPKTDGARLFELWRDAKTGMYRLKQLRSEDVVTAAVTWGLPRESAEAFLEAVEKRNVEAFASRPITLRMLFREFTAHQSLPGTRVEIFRRGCERLCLSDPDRSRRLERHGRSDGNAKEICQIAGRLAAHQVLARRTGISLAPVELRSAHDLGIEELETDSESHYSELLAASLQTGLFSDAGEKRRNFTHPSYGEFLSAEHLKSFKVSQLLQLLCIRDGSRHYLVPQLCEIASWLALMNSEFLSWVTENEPEILLRNDLSALNNDERFQLASAVLTRMQREEIFDDWALRRHYSSLKHPRLAKQLRAYIKSSGFNPVARRVAVQIAAACGCTSLLDLLLSIVLNPHEAVEIREHSIRAVVELLPKGRLNELEPIALGQVGPDPNDELRGLALEAMVPSHWPVSRVLSLALSPSNTDIASTFASFFSIKAPNYLQPEDLPQVLDALSLISHPFDGPTERIATAAVILALEHLESPEVATHLLSIFHQKLLSGEMPLGFQLSGWGDHLASDPKARQLFITLLVQANIMTEELLRRFQMQHLVVVTADDCGWVLSQVREANAQKRALWALIAAVLWRDDADLPCREVFLETCADVPELARVVRWPRAVAVDSDEATWMRQTYEFQKQRQSTVQEEPPKPSRKELFQVALELAKVDWNKWPKLAWELQRPQDGSEIFAAAADFTNRPAWREATERERAAVKNVAREFLLSGNPSASDQPGRDGTVTDFWALRIFRDQIKADPTLTKALKAKWFDQIFCQPFGGTEEEQELAKLGVSLDPARAANCLRSRMEESIAKNGQVGRVLAGFELVWRADFTDVLREFIQRESITLVVFDQAVQFLARHDESMARSLIEARLKSLARKKSGAAGDTPALFALALALFPKEFWAKIWPAILNEESLAASTLHVLADIQATSIQKPTTKLDPRQMVEIYLILEKLQEAQPNHRLPQATKESLERSARFRHQILDSLISHGSREACDELLRLAECLPNQKAWIRWRWRDARASFLKASWQGVPPNVLTGMGAHNERRWVRSKDDLHELLLHSLSRLQEDLTKKEYPTARYLWNEPPPRLSPKPEEVLTECIARWLRDDLGKKNGIVLGCEVKPSVVHKTDIVVWAHPLSRPPSFEPFCVVIEVKRHFNPEIKSALETQLTNEYLLKFQRTHGIFVVGWYDCEGWKSNRNPLKVASYEEATEKLSLMASATQTKNPSLRLSSVCLNCGFPQAMRKHILTKTSGNRTCRQRGRRKNSP